MHNRHTLSLAQLRYISWQSRVQGLVGSEERSGWPKRSDCLFQLDRTIDCLTPWPTTYGDTSKTLIDALEPATLPEPFVCLEPSLESVYRKKEKIYRESSEGSRLKMMYVSLRQLEQHLKKDIQTRRAVWKPGGCAVIRTQIKRETRTNVVNGHPELSTLAPASHVHRTASRGSHARDGPGSSYDLDGHRTSELT
jgi:hypothetical protein